MTSTWNSSFFLKPFIFCTFDTFEYIITMFVTFCCWCKENNSFLMWKFEIGLFSIWFRAEPRKQHTKTASANFAKQEFGRRKIKTSRKVCPKCLLPSRCEQCSTSWWAHREMVSLFLLFSCRFPDFFSFHFVYLKWRNFLQSPRRKQAKQLKTQWGKVWLLFCALLWLQFQHPLSFLGLISADPSFSVEKVSSLSLMCKSSAM